jgi:hypothetical protein
MKGTKYETPRYAVCFIPLVLSLSLSPLDLNILFRIRSETANPMYFR